MFNKHSNVVEWSTGLGIADSILSRVGWSMQHQ